MKPAFLFISWLPPTNKYSHFIIITWGLLISKALKQIFTLEAVEGMSFLTLFPETSVHTWRKAQDLDDLLGGGKGWLTAPFTSYTLNFCDPEEGVRAWLIRPFLLQRIYC